MTYICVVLLLDVFYSKLEVPVFVFVESDEPVGAFAEVTELDQVGGDDLNHLPVRKVKFALIAQVAGHVLRRTWLSRVDSQLECHILAPVSRDLPCWVTFGRLARLILGVDLASFLIASPSPPSPPGLCPPFMVTHVTRSTITT